MRARRAAESVRTHARRPHAASQRHGESTRFRTAARRERQSPRIVMADVFKGVILRERRRAERSNEQLLMVSVSSRHDGIDLQSVWNAVVEALASATRETDVAGWLDPNRTISVVMPGIQGSAAALAPVLQERVHAELAKRLTTRSLEKIAVEVCAHTGQSQNNGETLSPLPNVRAGSDRQPYSFIKRAFDMACSLALLAVLLPIFVAVAVLVKLTSRGPVFFRQQRIGFGAKPFTMLKFRTMRVNADHKLHQEFVTNYIKSAGASKEAAGQPVFKIEKDPRVTPIGRILRKTSLDELPQLWNVVRGDMSLVGPRPPLQYEVEQYEAWHRRRVIEAKPGMTGLWQVKGRSRTSFDDMVRLDLRYVKTCSLSTDLKILLATPAAVITGKGAC